MKWVSKKQRMRDEILNLREEVDFHKKDAKQLETELEELKTRTQEEEVQPLKNYDVDLIVLDEAVSQLKSNPDFELFINFLYDEKEYCHNMMYIEARDQHDYWKGRIHSYKALITQISYGIKNLADNERKKLLDKERKKE